MSSNQYAKLAVMPLLFLLAAIGPLKEPLKVKFQLADGVRIAGDLSAWDRDGFEGSFGRRLWIDLKTDDLWKLYQRLMDPESAEQWVDLGRALLQCPAQNREARELAERAFQRAIQVDAAASERIDRVRVEAAELERKRRDDQKRSEQAKLKTTSPEGENWPTDTWPVLSDIEQEAAVLEIRADAQKRLSALGLAFVPVETDHFMVFSDLPRAEVARLAVQLEKVCSTFRAVMMPTPELQPPGKNQPRWFWGKAAVFLFNERDQFRLMEVESFRQLVPQSTTAICHPAGSKIFVNACKGDDEDLFNWMLMHATVQGILHGYQTPKRLPPWANDGLAERITTLVLHDSALAAQRRRMALEFIRGNGNINALLDWTYAEQTWPGPAQIGLPVGGLVIELLLNDRDLLFIDWAKAVKQGEDWQKALRPQLAITRQSLVETVVQYYKVND